MLRLFVACSHGCGSCAVSYFAKDDDMVCGGTFISVLCFYIYIKKNYVKCVLLFLTKYSQDFLFLSWFDCTLLFFIKLYWLNVVNK